MTLILIILIILFLGGGGYGMFGGNAGFGRFLRLRLGGHRADPRHPPGGDPSARGVAALLRHAPEPAKLARRSVIRWSVTMGQS